MSRRDGTSIGVVVLDIMEVLMSMMEDDRIVCSSNIPEGYNFWNGTTTESDIYREIHTGKLWNPTRLSYVGDDPEKLPLISFMTKLTMMIQES